MRAVLQYAFIIFVAGFTAKAQIAATQPTATQPGASADRALGAAAVKPAASTQPSTGVIRGHLSATVGWDLHKPDLSRAVVYLSADPALDASAKPPMQATMGQRDKAFVPNFLVVSCGTDVEFPNWDHISHNVFSRSKAAPAFDLDRYPYGMSKTRKFDKVGVVQVFCNIHPQMRAVILVTPNAFFARTDTDGHFELKAVPLGRHELVVWHERCEEQHLVVDVKEGQAPDLACMLEESRRSINANDPPARRGAYGVERGLGVKRERLDLPVVEGAHPAPTEDQQAH